MPDSNQIVAATIKVDTGASNQAVQGLNKDVSALKGNLKDAGATAKVTGKDVEGSAGSFGKLKEQMAGLPGPLAAVSEGGSKVNAIFKTLAGNPLLLILTGIVAVLTLLYKAFTNTFEGAEKVEQIFSGIKASAQALFDNLGHLASAIVKFFKFDFSGAVAEIKAVAGAVADAYNKMSALTKQAQELHKEQLANDLDQAERAKKLAILREQATDDTIPIAKRKAALLELKNDAEQNAKDDVDLAKRTTENKIAQLTLQKDGAKKNQDEINKLKIDQIRVETDNANELRRIGKQITAADKQELAERKEAAAKAAEEAKRRRAELVEFTNKLSKIQQENELATITDTYEKEKKQLQNKIADDKRANDVAFQDKKLTRAQFDQLNAALDIQSNLQLDALSDKHNKDVADKEAAFQKELNGILGKIKLDSIVNQRESERTQLKITYEQQLADASKAYKDNADHLRLIQAALAEQLRADQQKLEEKFAKEDAKNALERSIKGLKGVADDPKVAFKARQAAIDAEQAQFKKAFDDKVITEAEYNNQVDALAQARKAIGEAEHQQRIQQTLQFGSNLNALGQIIGEQTVAGKVLGIAAATINTWVGASEALKQPSVLPSPFDVIAKVANVATVIATGLNAVKNIVKVSVPGGSGGSAPSAGSISTPPAPVTPAQVSTTFTTQQNATRGTAADNRAYVVDADIGNAADRNARLNRAARLGG